MLHYQTSLWSAATSSHVSGAIVMQHHQKLIKPYHDIFKFIIIDSSFFWTIFSNSKTDIQKVFLCWIATTSPNLSGRFACFKETAFAVNSQFTVFLLKNCCDFPSTVRLQQHVAAIRITYTRDGAHTHILSERVLSSFVMDSFMARNVPTHGTQFVPLKCCASISA